MTTELQRNAAEGMSARRRAGMARARVATDVLLELLWVIGLTMLLVWWLVGLRSLLTHGADDFTRFLASATAWRAGGAPYSVASNGWNLNPPPFLLLIVPLTSLPPSAALLVWEMANVIALAVAWSLVQRELNLRPTRRMFLAFTLFGGTAAQIMLGQVAWLLVLPMTLAWREWRQGRLAVAGCWVGLLVAIKPLFLPLLAVYVIRRQWRGLGSAVVAALLLASVGAVAVGIDAYRAWFGLGASVDWFARPLNASIRGVLARVGDAPPLTALWVGLSCVVGIVTLRRLHSRPADADYDLAVVFLATLLVAPLGWVYYLPVALGPLAALEWRRSGGVWPKVLLLALFWPAGVGWGSLDAQLKPGLLIGLSGTMYAIGTATLWWLALHADGRVRLDSEGEVPPVSGTAPGATVSPR